jgi:hypothetical protein
MANFYNNKRLNSEPCQKLPLAKKTQEWKEENVDAIIGKSNFGAYNNNGRKVEMKIAYDLYNSIFDENDFKYITDPYTTSEGFPASLQNFNIIKPKIDLLEGEETKRPFPFKVAQTNEEATSALQSKYKKMLSDTILEIATGGNPDEPVSEEDLDKVEAIGEYMSKDFSDVAEQLAWHSLNYLNEKENMKEKFGINFHDLLCANLPVGYVGQLNGEPVYERVNPLYFSCDISPESGHIEDGDWAARKMHMTWPSIYDRFYDIMEESDLDELISKFNTTGSTSKKNQMDTPNGITWREGPTWDGYNNYTDNTTDVWHVVWKSLVKVGFLVTEDEDGNPIMEVVDESYKPDKGEDIEWDWVTEIWEGYRIGDDMYIGIRPIPNQSISIDNPNSTTLPYVGVISNNKNSESKSLVEIMKPLQYLYIAIMYQLQLAISRDKGKIITVDVTQIPKSLGIDANKWLHYLSSTGVNFINPYETGYDTPGREGGKAASFNQFGQTDLSMSNVIVQYIQLMNKIEEMIGELSGVSRQRQGQVQSSELVGNVQQTIVQSSHITEYLFYTHTQFKKRVYTKLLNTAKDVWANSGKKKLHYLTDDMTRVFMDITDSFLYSDMDIFVSDSTKEHQNVEALKQLAQPAMQNGATLLDIAELYTSDNLTDIKHKLTKIEAAKQKREEQMQQMQQQAQQQQTEVMAQIEQGKQQLEQQKLQIQESDSIRKADTSIQVALIQAENKAAIEAGKQMIEYSKLDTTSEIKQSELDFKSKELKETKRSNEAEESIKRIAANKPTTSSNK